MHITFSGLRGGSGTTSLAAMLADSLRLLGESVLLVDLHSTDLLRLHFTIPYKDGYGWAFAEKSGIPWYQHTYQIDPNLWVLPYGRNGLASLKTTYEQDEAERLWNASTALKYIKQSTKAPAWVIFDAPADVELYANLRQSSDFQILVAQPDMASHILLGQYPLDLYPNTKILINGMSPERRLSEAIILDWDLRYAQRLLPVRFHEDSHVHEALAHKMPATSYFPASSAAQNMQSLALWCITQRGVSK